MRFKQLGSSWLGAVLLAAGGPLPAAAQPVVGASVQIGQPGFYGRLDISNAPPPQLLYPQPLIIQPPPVAVPRAPIYLHVPPGHAKNWRKHCARYGACGQPVYFVDERWYQEVYGPSRLGPPGPGPYRDDDGYGRPKHKEKHRERHEYKHGHGHGDKHHGKGRGKHDD